jgi:taurine dioxygenase
MTHALSGQALSPFGLEIDLDLQAPMNSSTLAHLRALFAEHHLLLFRKQKMEMYQQIKVAKRFGPVVSVNGFTVGEYISNCRPDGALGNAEICFHSDLSFSRYPYQAILMQATDVVDGASSTKFASGARAYGQLPAATRERLLGLQALLVWPLDPAKRNRNAEVPPHYPRAVQPLVWTHPATGQQSLYLDHNATDSILGVPPDEGEDLLQELWRYELATENVYEHFWKTGDTLLWDNMVLLHARGEVSTVGNRTLQRVTIAEKGYADIFPQVDVRTSLGQQEPVIYRGQLSLTP